MRLLTILPLCLLSAIVVAKPATNNNKIVVTKDFFPESNIVYTSQHDIANIDVPLNRINFDDDDDDDNDDNLGVTVFFAEADVNGKGKKEDRGLYVLEKNKATKILDNGRDAASFHDGSKNVYLGASDGIYVYDGTDKTTKKYGTITDSIIQIEANNKTGVIYFVTEEHEVFSVAEEGTKKNKIEALKNVKEIVFDFKGNLFYRDNKKDVFVYTEGRVKKIDSISGRNDIKLIKPMFAQEDGVYSVVGNTLYLLSSEGDAKSTGITFRVKPTAYAPEATLIQYYALDKKIYEYNVLELVISELTDLKNFLNDKANEIQTIATKSRSSFGVNTFS